MPFEIERLHSELARLRGGSPSHGLGAALSHQLAQDVVHFEQIGSTNDEAISAARQGAKHGSVFIADSQTAGRGRRGKSWSSPAGENLLFSVLVRSPLELKTASRLTLAVGLAVRDAIAEYTKSAPQLKWPNDVWVDGKKLAGILVESQLSGDKLDSVVIGVGANVLSRDLPEEIASLATSLALSEQAEGAPRLTREGVLARVLIQLERRLGQFEREGLSSMLDELRAHDGLLGRTVRVDERRGTARGIDQNGALLLEVEDGTYFHIENGTIELA
ncbi:MAG: biotin--[acetyl-CoA-carboxylase] ligase [Polyangiaceae bacterium]|nr:biotin--[acetyl-CoA-carboxylase] ligase [Polyangiaceae bacterium]